MAEPKSSKSKASPAAKPVKKPTQQPEPTNWLNSNVLAGGLIILVGVMFLLSNTGLVNLNWGEIWKLWPILIIIGGLSVLNLTGRVANIVHGLVAVATVLLLWFALTGQMATERTAVTTDEFVVEQTNSRVETLDVELESGMIDLNIDSHSGDEMLLGTIESKLSELKHQSTLDGTTQKVKLSQQRNWQWLGSDSLNKLDIELSQQVPTNLQIDTGTSSIDADLSEVDLQSLLIDSGASSVKLRLGDKASQTEVEVDAGVSSIEILVPEDSGVELYVDAGLSSSNLPDGYDMLDDGKNGKHVYRSANYDKATSRIVLRIDMGLSSFDLKTY